MTGRSKIKFIRIVQIACFVIILGVLKPLSIGAATFKDARGKQISLEKAPVRIVPLVPSLTEILYYIGLGDRVAGVAKFSDYPPEAEEKPIVGSYANLNVEKIISLSPDLVIGTMDGNSESDIELLEEAKIPVFVVNPRNIKDVISIIGEIATLCGVKERGEEVADDLSRRLERVKAKVRGLKKPSVFLQINLRPIVTVNKNTCHNDLITLAGGINIAKNEPITYPRISIEELIRKRPDIIIISSMQRGGEFKEARKEWMNWTLIPAVKNNRVHLIKSDIIDRPSPRIIEGLEALARLIHPEAAWENTGSPVQGK
jgi:iron complex transport system substrate-binding protein